MKLARASGPLERLECAGVVLLQLLLLALVPLADARLAPLDAGRELHVESEGRTACFAHDHLRCQLCRQVDSRLAAAAPAETPVATPRPAALGRAPRPLVLAQAPSVSGLGPRAPPAS